MSGKHRHSSEQGLTGLLRDISSAEKSVRIILLSLMVVALVALAFGAVWEN